MYLKELCKSRAHGLEVRSSQASLIPPTPFFLRTGAAPLPECAGEAPSGAAFVLPHEVNHDGRSPALTTSCFPRGWCVRSYSTVRTTLPVRDSNIGRIPGGRHSSRGRGVGGCGSCVGSSRTKVDDGVRVFVFGSQRVPSAERPIRQGQICVPVAFCFSNVISKSAASAFAANSMVVLRVGCVGRVAVAIVGLGMQWKSEQDNATASAVARTVSCREQIQVEYGTRMTEIGCATTRAHGAGRTCHSRTCRRASSAARVARSISSWTGKDTKRDAEGTGPTELKLSRE